MDQQCSRFDVAELLAAAENHAAAVMRCNELYTNPSSALPML